MSAFSNGICSPLSRVAAQILLGEGRPVIGEVRLGAHEGDAAVGVPLADLLRRRGARQAATDQQIAYGCHNWLLSVAALGVTPGPNTDHRARPAARR